MDATPGARLLRPVADTVRPDAAPFVRLSPTKGMRNASILYEAIRSMPDGTLLRGDFDKKARPLVYFPDRPPKKVELKSPIKAKNIDADRRELANFLSSIVEAAYTSADPSTKLIKASVDLKLKIHAVAGNGGDFTAGDIRQALHTIANAYVLENVRKLTSPHRLVPAQGSQIQGKRFREFIKMDRARFDQLAKALEDPAASKYDTTAMIAVFEMKELLRGYLAQPADRKKPFVQFLRLQGITPHQRFFAERWRQISRVNPTQERKDLVTESWSYELDKVCHLIELESKRNFRLGDDEDKSSNHVSRKPSRLLPGLPPVMSASDRQRLDDENTAEQRAQSRSPRSQMFSPEQPATPEEERTLEKTLQSASELPKLDLGQDEIASAHGEVLTAGLVLSPKHGLPPPLLPPLSASAHLLAEGQALGQHRVLVTARRQPNPLYTRPDLNLFEADNSDDMNQLRPAETGSGSDLLASAFVPNQLLPYARGEFSLKAALPNLNRDRVPYHPIQPQQKGDAELSGETTQSSQSPEDSEAHNAEVTESDGNPDLRQSSWHDPQPPSLMMVYPKQGYSPLDLSTTEEEQ